MVMYLRYSRVPSAIPSGFITAKPKLYVPFDGWDRRGRVGIDARVITVSVDVCVARSISPAFDKQVAVCFGNASERFVPCMCAQTAYTWEKPCDVVGCDP
jgi:hypothetical protein